MKTAALLAALVMTLTPSAVLAMCEGHDEVTMSCPEGQTFDSESRSCITPTG